jgi:hypothetical protein
MDNCVGQNKSICVMMFYAFLSMTLFPDGVALHYLSSGHSHFVPDRVIGACKHLLQGQSIYLPNELTDKFNKMETVNATYIDHNDEDAFLISGEDICIYFFTS